MKTICHYDTCSERDNSEPRTVLSSDKKSKQFLEKGFYNSELYFKKSCLVVKTLIKKGLVLGSFVKEVSSFMVEILIPGDRCRTGCHDITLQNMQIVCVRMNRLNK